MKINKLMLFLALSFFCSCDNAEYYPKCKLWSDHYQWMLTKCFEYKSLNPEGEYCQCILNSCVNDLDFRQCEKKANIS